MVIEIASIIFVRDINIQTRRNRINYMHKKIEFKFWYFILMLVTNRI